MNNNFFNIKKIQGINLVNSLKSTQIKSRNNIQINGNHSNQLNYPTPSDNLNTISQSNPNYQSPLLKLNENKPVSNEKLEILKYRSMNALRIMTSARENGASFPQLALLLSNFKLKNLTDTLKAKCNYIS